MPADNNLPPLPPSVAAALDRVRDRLAETDFALDEAQSRSLASAKEAETGIARGEGRLREIEQALSGLENEGADPRAAAAALIAGESVIEATGSIGLLKEEAAAVRRGIDGLRPRASQARAQVEIAQKRAGRAVASIVDAELVPAMAEEAKRIVGEIETLFATAKALSHATDGTRVRHYADALGGALNQIRRAASRSTCKLVEPHGDRKLSVPKEVGNAMEPAADALAALQQYLPGWVPFPNYLVSAAAPPVGF